MSIDKQELFRRTRALWPNEIGQLNQSVSISLAQLLNDIYYDIESSIDENDHWMQISIWAFHQSISKYSAGCVGTFYSEKVEFEVFDKMMIQNLTGDECWASERDTYLNS